MILTTIITTFFRTILEWLVSGATYVASEILKDVIRLFDGDIFANILNEIPMLTDIGAYSILRAIGLGLAVFLVIWSAIKSIISPIMGEDQPNAANIIIRGAFTIVLIVFFYANTYEGNQLVTRQYIGSSLEEIWSGDGFRLGGFISMIGKLFGLILHTISERFSTYVDVDIIPNFSLTGNLGNDASHSLALCVLTASLLTSVLGAAMAILERIISLAITVLMGPICIAMYASPSTADTFKQWFLSLLTQFLALLMSMILWISFIEQMNVAFNNASIFSIALTIVILSLVKNSEKILNTFGLRTMNVGDSARAIGAGFGVLTAGAGLAMTAGNMAANIKQSGTLLRGPGGGGNRDASGKLGIQNVLSGEANKSKLFANTQSRRNFQRTMGNVKTGLTTWNPRAIANMRSQNKAYDTLFAKDGTINQKAENVGQNLNDLFGFDSSSEVRFGNDMKYTEYKTNDGTLMQGYQGMVEFNEIDGKIIKQEAFVPLTNNGVNIANTEFSKSKVVDNFGTRVYYNDNNSTPEPEAKAPERTEISSEVFEAKN